MNPLIWSRAGSSELDRSRARPSRSVASRSSKAPRRQGGMAPSRASSSLNRSSLAPCRPQSSCITITISSVPSSRCETLSDRNASSVTRPPALRMMCASPRAKPSIVKRSIRASMHASTATFRRGCGPRPLAANSSFREAATASISSACGICGSLDPPSNHGSLRMNRIRLGDGYEPGPQPVRSSSRGFCHAWLREAVLSVRCDHACVRDDRRTAGIRCLESLVKPIRAGRQAATRRPKLRGSKLDHRGPMRLRAGLEREFAPMSAEMSSAVSSPPAW